MENATQELKDELWKTPPSGFRRSTLRLTAAGVCRDAAEKFSGFSFHLRSSANSSEASSSQPPRTQINEEFIMINFNNLIVGRHESKVLSCGTPKRGSPCLGHL